MTKEKIYSAGTLELCQLPESEKFSCKSLAVKAAKARGYGFIVEHETKDGEVRKNILAWNVEVISYNEACLKYGHDAAKMQIILRSKKQSEVYIVSPAGNNEEIILPFSGYNRLEVVKDMKTLND